MDEKPEYDVIDYLFVDHNKIMIYLYNALIRSIILWNLSKEDLHGYALMTKVDDFFKNSIKIGLLSKTRTSKIYPILKDMRESGVIESYDGLHDNKRVLTYHLTPKGIEALHIFRQRLNDIMDNKDKRDFLKFTLGIEYDIIYED
ncbi:PadR family transcriptional regulator [Methanosphaera sp.]